MITTNIVYPKAFAGKPVVINPKGQGARRGRLRFCPDLSARRRQRLDYERRKREEDESMRKHQEERAQELANAPDAAELVTMFRELFPWLNRDREARVSFADMFQIYKKIHVDSRGPPAAA